MSDSLKWTLLLSSVAAVFTLALIFQSDEARSYATSGFGNMNAAKLSKEAFRVAPVMLETVYRAFGETDETAIYDDLAQVAAGEALEALYLERVGAMAGGGLDQSDQQLHEMELIRLTSRGTGTTIRWDAEWRVIGTVGHATHLHVRGNTYAASLTLEPVDGAWRMIAFDLTDVDRSDAGTLVAAQ